MSRTAWRNDSIAAMDRLVERSKRQTGIQLPPSFARSDTGAKDPPLARMVKGRRGADVRIKLYLSTVLLAGGSKSRPGLGASSIHNVSGAAWARALHLDATDSPVAARQIAQAQTWLADNNLLRVIRRRGQEPIVVLRSGDGLGRKWVRPTRYIRIPLELWSNKWIWVLDAKELAVLIAVLDFQGGRPPTPGGYWMAADQQNRYRLSPDTWRLASASLVAKGLMETRYEKVEQRDFETVRRRKRYLALPDRLADDALEEFDPVAEAAET